MPSSPSKPRPASRPPGGSELGAWAAVGCWTAVIYLAIPFARRLERFFGGLLGGPTAFLVLGTGVVLSGVVATAIWLYRTRSARNATRYLWLAAIGAAFFGYATRLKAPVEALHFAEYAVLSLLVFRALSRRFHDRGVYLCAVLVCALVGTVDELLQWITPDRYGDLSDVAINVTAAGLTQLALWKGVAPGSIEPRWGRPTLRLATALAAAQVVLLLGWVSATPERLATIPLLASMAHNPSVLAEYGHRHHDPEIGTFYSRFTLAEIAEIDRARGDEVAVVLDRFRDPASYRQFLVEHSAGASPFVHEARVRLYRRNRVLERMRAEPNRQHELANVAWRENRILERYFPTTLAASAYELPPRRRAELESLTDPSSSYTSPVGNHLITSIDERRLQALGGIALIALVIAFRRLGKSPPAGAI